MANKKQRRGPITVLSMQRVIMDALEQEIGPRRLAALDSSQQVRLFEIAATSAGNVAELFAVKKKDSIAYRGNAKDNISPDL